MKSVAQGLGAGIHTALSEVSISCTCLFLRGHRRPREKGACISSQALKLSLWTCLTLSTQVPPLLPLNSKDPTAFSLMLPRHSNPRGRPPAKERGRTRPLSKGAQGWSQLLWLSAVYAVPPFIVRKSSMTLGIYSL